MQRSEFQRWKSILLQLWSLHCFLVTADLVLQQLMISKWRIDNCSLPGVEVNYPCMEEVSDSVLDF